METRDSADCVENFHEEVSINEENPEEIYTFNTSLLYHYTRVTINIVPTRNLSNSFKYEKCYRVLHIMLLISAWSYTLYKIYKNTREIKVFLSSFDFLLEIMLNATNEMKFPVLQTIGYFLLKKHLSVLQTEIKNVLEMSKIRNNETTTHFHLKEIERKSNKRMMISLSGILVLNIAVRVIPLGALLIQDWWKLHSNITVETLQIFFDILSCVVAMPYLFYFIMLIQVQELHLTIFFDIVENENNSGQAIYILKHYKALHQSFVTLSKNNHTYIVYLVTFLALSGSISIYVGIKDLLVLSTAFNPKFPLNRLAVAEMAVMLVYQILNTIILYVWPLILTSRLSSKQKEIVPKMLLITEGINQEEMSNVAFKIHILQTTSGTGYNFFGGPVTEWKTLFLAILGPLFKIFISKFK